MRAASRFTGMVALLSLGAANALAATINPTAAERFQEVDAIIGGSENPSIDNDSDIVFHYAPYNNSLNANASLGTPGTDPTNNSVSSQVSDIQDETIFATGNVSAAADLSHIFGVAAAGTNTFEVTFDILADINYTLTGSIDADSTGISTNASANIVLTGPGGDLVNLSTTNGLVPVNSAGLLTAGTYTLSAESTVFTNGAGAAGSGDFDFVLVVPEPASLGLLAVGLLFMRRR